MADEMDQFENDLERLLQVYRFHAPPPDFRRVVPMRASRRWWPALAVAAALILAIGVAAFYPRQNEWKIAGRIRALQPGEVIHADRDLRLRSRAVGVIDVAAGSTMHLIENGRHHRIALESGSIHAVTISPPGVFVVDTPKARAVDFGCEYVLAIAKDGSGSLRVTAGWVRLEEGSAQSFVPQGAAARIGSNGELTAAVFEDAAPAFRQAVENFARDHDVDTIAKLARPRDTFTLLHLFRPATPDERVVLRDAMIRLLPPDAPQVSREEVRGWYPDVTEGWWPFALKAANIGPLKKPKGMLPRR